MIGIVGQEWFVLFLICSFFYCFVVFSLFLRICNLSLSLVSCLQHRASVALGFLHQSGGIPVFRWGTQIMELMYLSSLKHCCLRKYIPFQLWVGLKFLFELVLSIPYLCFAFLVSASKINFTPLKQNYDCRAWAGMTFDKACGRQRISVCCVLFSWKLRNH